MNSRMRKNMQRCDLCFNFCKIRVKWREFCPHAESVLTARLNKTSSEVILNHSALLVLEDGTVFRGVSIGADGCAAGEVVFNTAMTGYQEILTDPSYTRQLVTLTYPHIGNTGTNDEDEESDRIQAAALIIHSLPLIPSNFRSTCTLPDYFKAAWRGCHQRDRHQKADPHPPHQGRAEGLPHSRREPL